MNPSDPYNPYVDPDESSERKEKRKRRSKNDQIGRSFKCDICQKAYLSQPALTNHRKMKHDIVTSDPKRGRGRPRKNPYPGTFEKSEIKFKYFFEREPQKKIEGEPPIRAADFISGVFEDIYIKYQQHCYNKNLFKAEDHPLFEKILVGSTNSSKNNIFVDKKSTDDAMIDYIKYLEANTNHEFFGFAIRFVILYREWMNKYLEKEIDRSKVSDFTQEYTELYTAELAPQLSNYFFTVFMHEAHYFGMSSEREKIALIDMIQHFIQWLFENNHTSCKINLVNS